MKKAAIILTIGALIAAFSAFNFPFSAKENLVGIGNFQITQHTKHSLPVLTIVGGAVMAIGVGAYMLAFKRFLNQTT